ncbi:HD-GYP domain-containing protein [Methylomagnum ishizawai]|uniref:HD-GYP domain-containing protein n=1 Tax=Methylomagnum ishizawai TaxID=1760988 RepID=UPI001C32C450|nr:HD-GYP domain-containing protein [Methylomagnum ishizawai]BBL75278.1 metal-dependent phosphohydrolase [Methylomagnum ishizawai]
MDHPPRKVDYVEKVKLRVGELRPGMFVCELDRPWLETPFLFQGFEIRSEDDIEVVARHCEYVYIDLLRTRRVEISLDAAPPPRSYMSREAISAYEKEVEVADNARRQTTQLVKNFVDEVRFGKSVDILVAKSAVAECVSNVIRNPESMLFVARMRDTDALISQHAFNVCTFSVVLGHYMGLDAKQLENLGTCGLLHDIGKVAIPAAILNKRGKLAPEEVTVVRNHAEQGRNILMSGRNVFSGTVDVAYGHHEHMDGSGYPRGLQDHQLNLNCKIVAVADRYDALVSQRPFRPAYNHLDAIRLLNQMATGRQLDHSLTAGFVACMGAYPPGTVVELSTGEIAIVLQANPKQRLRPQIMVVRNAAGASCKESLVDMALKEVDDKGRPYKIKTVHRAEDFGIDLEKHRHAILNAFG